MWLVAILTRDIPIRFFWKKDSFEHFPNCAGSVMFSYRPNRTIYKRVLCNVIFRILYLIVESVDMKALESPTSSWIFSNLPAFVASLLKNWKCGMCGGDFRNTVTERFYQNSQFWTQDHVMETSTVYLRVKKKTTMDSNFRHSLGRSWKICIYFLVDMILYTLHGKIRLPCPLCN